MAVVSGDFNVVKQCFRFSRKFVGVDPSWEDVTLVLNCAGFMCDGEVGDPFGLPSKQVVISENGLLLPSFVLNLNSSLII